VGKCWVMACVRPVPVQFDQPDDTCSKSGPARASEIQFTTSLWAIRDPRPVGLPIPVKDPSDRPTFESSPTFMEGHASMTRVSVLENGHEPHRHLRLDQRELLEDAGEHRRTATMDRALNAVRQRSPQNGLDRT
jgi:hypothetical protein